MNWHCLSWHTTLMMMCLSAIAGEPGHIVAGGHPQLEATDAARVDAFAAAIGTGIRPPAGVMPVVLASEPSVIADLAGTATSDAAFAAVDRDLDAYFIDLRDRYSVAVDEATCGPAEVGRTCWPSVARPLEVLLKPDVLLGMASEFIPGVGTALQAQVDDLVDQRERANAATLRAALGVVERHGAWSALTGNDPQERLRQLETTLRKLRYLADSEGLLTATREDPRTHEEVQDSTLRLLVQGVDDLRKVVATQQSELGASSNDLRVVRAHMLELKSGMRRTEGAVRELQARVKPLLPGTAPNSGSQPPSTQRSSTIEFADTARIVAADFDGLATLFDGMGRHGQAHDMRVAGQLAQFAVTVAMCVDNPLLVPAALGQASGLLQALTGAGPSAQQQMLASIQAALREMTQLLVKQHAEEMRAFIALNQNVISVMAEVREIHEEDIKQCYRVIPADAYFPVSRTLDSRCLVPGVVPEYRSARAYRAMVGREPVTECKAAMTKCFERSTGARPSSLLCRPDLKFPEPSANHADVTFSVAPLVRLLEDTRAFVSAWMIDGASIRFGAITPDVSDTVSASLRDWVVPMDPTSRELLQADILNEELDPAAVRLYGGVLVGMVSTFDLTDAHGALYPWVDNAMSDLPSGADKDAVSNNGERYIRHASIVVDASIAQEAMLTGDLLLPIAHAAWTETDDTELVCGDWPGHELLAVTCAPDRRSVENTKPAWGAKSNATNHVADALRRVFLEKDAGLLWRNRLLAQNVALYAVCRRLDRWGQAPVGLYEQVLAVRESDSLLRQFLGDRVTVFWKDATPVTPQGAAAVPAHWAFTVADRDFAALPSPNQVAARTPLLTPHLPGLLLLRRRLAERRIAYELLRQEAEGPSSGKLLRLTQRVRLRN